MNYNLSAGGNYTLVIRSGKTRCELLSSDHGYNQIGAIANIL